MSLRDRLRTARSRLRPSARVPQAPPFALIDLYSARSEDAEARVGVLVYQGVTTAEINEPVRRLACGLDADVVHIGAAGGPATVVGVEPVRVVHVDLGTDDPAALTIDVLVLPGGLGWARVVEDVSLVRWVIDATKNTKGVLAISTGSLILASAGGLAGQAATGHWLARDALSALGADVRTDRAVHAGDDRIVTASGANSAIEAAAEMARRVRWGPR